MPKKMTGKKPQATLATNMEEPKEGRPTKFKPEMAEQARKLCLLGATEAQMAEFFQVSIQTLYNWRETYPAFLESITQGKILADANVAESLYNRARGYSHAATKIMVVDKEVIHEEYTERFPPDTQAASLWLRNRQSALWRDKTEHGLTDREGNDVPLTALDMARRAAFLFAQAEAEGSTIQ